MNRTSFEEKKKLYDQGMTYTEIANVLGISRQAVQSALSGSKYTKFVRVKESSCVWPGLRAWMNENKVSVSELIRKVGDDNASPNNSRFREYLSGRRGMSKRHIDKILRATGLTYEEAFCEREEEFDGCLQN